MVLDDRIEAWLEWLAERGCEPPERDDPRSIYRPAALATPADRGATWAPARYAAEHSEAAFMTEQVLAWLARPERSDTPWFAHVSYLRPHPPYLAPAPYHDMFDPAAVPSPVRAATPAEEAATHPFLATALELVRSPGDELDQRQLQATYLGMIAEVDHQLGRLLDGLDQLGASDGTLVIVTSDHGEQLGDHWLIEKLGFFDQSYRIPLIIRFPGAVRAPGRATEVLTENVDIMPTILDLCGVERPAWADGGSLRQVLEDKEPPADWWRDAVHYEYDFRMPELDLVEEVLGLRQDQCSIATIRDHKAKYVHFSGGLPPLFYDLEVDPAELVDLAGDPEQAARVLEYAQRLLTLRNEHLDPRYANTRATAVGTLHRADPPRERPVGPVG